MHDLPSQWISLENKQQHEKRGGGLWARLRSARDVDITGVTELSAERHLRSCYGRSHCPRDRCLSEAARALPSGHSAPGSNAASAHLLLVSALQSVFLNTVHPEVVVLSACSTVLPRPWRSSRLLWAQQEAPGPPVRTLSPGVCVGGGGRSARVAHTFSRPQPFVVVPKNECSLLESAETSRATRSP